MAARTGSKKRATKGGKSPRASSARGSDKKKKLLDAMRAFVRSEGMAYLDDPNITSIGIGHKITGGQRGNELCIQFTVRKKGSGSQLEALDTQPIPETVQIAGQRIPTDVIQRDYRPAYELVAEAVKDVRKQRLTKLVAGISVGHPATTAGTLGAIVFDRRDGLPCVLSNWHVLNTPTGKPGDAMLQPGPFDDNRTDQNRAGTLVRSHLGVAGDCAIARIEGREFDSAILDLQTGIGQLARPELGDRVVKSGRTTAVTRGLVRRVDTVAKIDYGGEFGEQRIGCFEIGPDSDHPTPGDQISMGGDSGSVWLIRNRADKATDIMVGLHFGGEGTGDPDDHALACYAHSVFEKLEIAPSKPDVVTDAVAEAGQATGYDANFIGSPVPLPTLSAGVARDVVRLNGSHLLPYMHFSVCMSKSRRFPRFVGWNIDGGSIKLLSRKGLKFVLDLRIDAGFQVGDELYVDNKLDRGHIARRADLCWGALADAKRANKDSFFFTNITPQHQAFNQSERHGLWGRLENAILDEVDVKDLRVSVMGGPILEDDDIEFRDLQIPKSFWKVIAYVDSADDQLKARAFILSQDNLLDDIEALELDPFRMFEVSLAELGQRIGLGFGALMAADAFVSGPASEVVGVAARHKSVREITSAADLVR